MELIILIIIILLLLAVIPTWPHSRGWGYNPSGIVVAILLIFIVLWLLGVFDRGTANDNNVMDDVTPEETPSGNVYTFRS